MDHKSALPSSVLPPEKAIREIVRYYTEVGPDYQQWSKTFNMHFGYYRMGMNPFNLESMLCQMNEEIVRRLALDRDKPLRILDLGCGMGATVRQVALAMPNARVSGITIVPWQAHRARELTQHHSAANRVQFFVGDYTALPFDSGTFDGVYALESSCYAPGSDKAGLLQEIWRVLKPGGRFVVADAFLKARRRMGVLTSACYRELCKCWSLEMLGNIHQFTECLQALGFSSLCVENISKNVTPSVLHIPATTARFLFAQLAKDHFQLDSRRWRNTAAGFLLMAFTVDRSRSGYFMVSGRKGETVGTIGQ